MPIKATNNFVFIQRDKTETEKSGLIIPTSGQVKQHIGTIVSVGNLVRDMKIKSGQGKKAMFHSTVGFNITHEEVEYVVLNGEEIIAIVS